MSRLIDADALINRMYHDAFENDESYNETNPMARWDSGLWIRYKMFENAIDDAPTIDAVEVVRGEWIDYTCGSGCYCSNCGWDGDDIIDECIIQDFDFCPNCGARMKDKDIDVPYKIASDQRDYDSTYEPTYNEQDGSM